MDHAGSQARRRPGRGPARLLVHTDLHYDNILASYRPGQPWVAIDPAPAVGAPERSVAELLWTLADELPGPQAITGLLGTFVENGQLDGAKATAWGFVRSIDDNIFGPANRRALHNPRTNASRSDLRSQTPVTRPSS